MKSLANLAHSGPHGQVPRFSKCLCFALGIASATGFAPLGLWPITLFAFAVLISVTVTAETLKVAAGRGYWFGVGHFLLGLNWIAGSFRYQETMPVWLGWVAVAGLALFLALYPALATGLAWRLGGGKRISFTFFFAASWIVTEFLRATLFTGFAWNPLGVIALDTGMQTLGEGVGTYGISGLVILAAGAVALLLGRQFGAAAIQSVILVGLTVTGLQYQFNRNHRQCEGFGCFGHPLLRIVQPNISQQDKHDSSFDAANFAKLEELTGIPGKEPRLILWPEAAIPDFLEEEEWARARVASLLGPKDLLLTGGDQLIYDRDRKLTGAHNSVFAVSANAQLAGRYDKAHLVPGGEYLPLRWLMEPLGATRLVPGDIDFHEGPGPKSLDLRKQGFAEVGIQICYEVIFSGHVIDPRPYARPAFVFNPSNDAWFGSWGPPQHLAQARLRAIEEGLPFVRATPTGISAIIDADGQIVKSLPLGKPGFIEARLPQAHAPTPFARYGNFLPLLFAGLLILMGIASRRRLG